MPLTDREIFDSLAPAAQHLLRPFSELRPIQRQAIPLATLRVPLLIVGPTASGKTEAALAPLLDLRARERWAGQPVILHVAPTRALVNDLHRRLATQLAGYLTIGRRTAEHQEENSDILICTPESLDSLIARRQRPGGHLLRHVRGIVLDELHVLADNARGAQLNILLSRLDAICAGSVLRLALSATVSDTEYVARRFLGPQARIVVAGGGRELLVFRGSPEMTLLPRPVDGVDPLAVELLALNYGSGGSRRLARLLLAGQGTEPLKALVFVSSRARCDKLAADLASELRGRSSVNVFSHHGSLAKRHREGVERALQGPTGGIVVATSTLELGIDIGDIELVVLEGPPGSVSSLLQRIGRANRRSSSTRVLPLAADGAQACTLASMLRAAAVGELDPNVPPAHYSVAIQQLASSFLQSPRGRLKRSQVELTWRAEFGDDAAAVLNALVESQILQPLGSDAVKPGDRLRELLDEPLRLHANIGSVTGLLPVVDAVSGDPVAWVPRQKAEQRLVIAGRSYKAVQTTDAIELRELVPRASNTLRYATRKAPITRAALRHLCFGLGLTETALVHHEGTWMHFGGALHGALLNLAGLHSTASFASSDPRLAITADFPHLVSRFWQTLEPLCGFGPYQSELPGTLRRRAVERSVHVESFRDWLVGLEEVSWSTHTHRRPRGRLHVCGPNARCRARQRDPRGLGVSGSRHSDPSPPALHDDDPAAGWGGDPRRHLRRQGLLGHQRHAKHRARQAGEGRQCDESEPRERERHRVLVPPQREERRRHARPQGLREGRRRPTRQAEVLQRRTS